MSLGVIVHCLAQSMMSTCDLGQHTEVFLWNVFLTMWVTLQSHFLLDFFHINLDMKASQSHEVEHALTSIKSLLGQGVQECLLDNLGYNNSSRGFQYFLDFCNCHCSPPPGHLHHTKRKNPMLLSSGHPCPLIPLATPVYFYGKACRDVFISIDHTTDDHFVWHKEKRKESFGQSKSKE